MPQSKKKASKQSTLKVREILDQIRQDVKPLFCEIFDGELASLKDLNLVECQQYPVFPTLIYLARHLLSPINVIMFGIELPIVPLFINLTADSFIKTDKERLINPSRIAVYFLHNDPEGGIGFDTCLLGAITISKKQEKKMDDKVEISKKHKRRIEF